MHTSRQIYEHVHRRLVYPLWALKDGHYPFKYLAEFEKSQYYTPEAIDRMQWQRLTALLRHAYVKCPFYRRHWEKAGIHPDDIRSWSDFRQMPMITKKHIQENRERMRRTDVPKTALVSNRTGGSTGEPLFFYHDKERMKSRCASTIRHDRWAGKDIGSFYAPVWGHFMDNPSMAGTLWEGFKGRWIYRNVFLDTSSLSVFGMKDFVETIRRTRPDYYVAYANSMYLFASFLRDQNISDFPKPEAIITSAEFLEPDRRKTIESVFEAPVYDRYGCRELSVIASECEAHDGMHVNAECLLVEILKDNQPVKSGELGEVVVTDLLNFGMPFIRYRIRDVASPVEGKCTCGRSLPRLKMAGGRATDFLVTPDGRIVSGAALTIYLIANTPGLRQGQLIQNEKERIIFRIIKGNGFSDQSVEILVKTGRRFLGEAVHIDFDYVDKIEPSPSGKNLFCISNVNPFS